MRQLIAEHVSKHLKKKSGDVSYDTTNAPAEDTIDVHGDKHKE